MKKKYLFRFLDVQNGIIRGILIPKQRRGYRGSLIISIGMIRNK